MGYYSLARKVGNAVRLAEVVHVLAKHGFADLLTKMGLLEGAPAAVLRTLRLIKAQEGEPMTQPARLRAALTELGPTFVKVGQILSTRPDLLGFELTKALEDLQDNVATIPFDDIRPSIEKSLGQTLDEAFAAFEPDPVAAASLSQVYRATLKSGETVAVKVQRPGIRETINADIRLLKTIAEWVEDNVRDFAWADPVSLVSEFSRSIHRELDFAIERQVIDTFRENFADDDGVFIPRTYPAVSSDTVLTMDFVDGVRIDALDQFPDRSSDPKIVAKRGCRAICIQVTEHRLFHADPHPGNILLTRNDQIAFLDFGMVGRLDRADVDAMAEALQGIFTHNVERCVEAVLLFTAAGEADDPAAFERDINDYITFEAQAVLSGGLVAKALESMIAILHRHRLQLAPRMSLLLKALATIESTGHLLDPDLDMAPILDPYVRRVIAQRYEPLHMLREARRDMLNTLRIGRELPQDLHDIVKALSKGRFRVMVSHDELETAAGHIDRASNRLTFGLITGSLIVGSSLLVTAGPRAQIIGIVGYSIAGLLGLGLLISIIRSRNF